uniref:Uncharacterized protein n=1 Tax=Oryza nivara TaxID=4536 RepID=A0A0E0HXF2_ORYNI
MADAPMLHHHTSSANMWDPCTGVPRRPAFGHFKGLKNFNIDSLSDWDDIRTAPGPFDRRRDGRGGGGRPATRWQNLMHPEQNAIGTNSSARRRLHALVVVAVHHQLVILAVERLRENHSGSGRPAAVASSASVASARRMRLGDGDEVGVERFVPMAFRSRCDSAAVPASSPADLRDHSPPTGRALRARRSNSPERRARPMRGQELDRSQAHHKQ